MKLPEKSPQLYAMSDSDIREIIDFPKSEKILNLFRLANDEYLYWDKFKYLDFPNTISKELAWAYLRTMVRSPQIRKFPLKDKYGNNFGYWLPDTILKILHYLDQHAGGQTLIEDPGLPASEKERHLISSIMEEAIASSQLEGAATTRKKAKEMLKSGRRPTNKAEHMILNNYITIKNIKNFVDVPLSKELILEIQTSMTKNTLEDPSAAGRFRREDEQVHVIDQRDGQILFEPPPASETDERINILCNYANNAVDKEFVHPVIKAIIIHFWFAYIHPFVDGNGRTARAIFYWYLLKNKYWLFEYVSISRILLKAPGQYLRAYLYSERDDLDITYFLKYNLRTINLAIKSLHAYLVKQQKEIRETKKLIKRYPGLNHRQYDLLHSVIDDVYATYSIGYHKNTHNIAYQTARTDLLELEQRGLLVRVKSGGKRFVFASSKNIIAKLKSIKNKIT